jgi:hypothetical protein
MSTKPAFTISPLDHLKRVLNNPTLMPRMYFGPGVVTEKKREFWHGELWQDSPLFGECKLVIGTGLYSTSIIYFIHPFSYFF